MKHGLVKKISERVFYIYTPLVIHLAFCVLVPATAKAFQKVAEGIAVLEVCIAVRRVSKLVSGCYRLYPIKFRKSLSMKF